MPHLLNKACRHNFTPETFHSAILGLVIANNDLNRNCTSSSGEAPTIQLRAALMRMREGNRVPFKKRNTNVGTIHCQKYPSPDVPYTLMNILPPPES